MGQYYQIEMIIDTPGEYGDVNHRHACVIPHDLDCGLKLMEFAHDGSAAVNAAILEMEKGDCAYLAVIGDYADADSDIAQAVGDGGMKVSDSTRKDRERLARELIASRMNHFVTSDSVAVKTYPYIGLRHGVTVFNEDRMECTYVPMERRRDDGGYVSVPNALMILCAVGNGRGGGDYHGSSMDWVGAWAFSKLRFADGDRTGGAETCGYRVIRPNFTEED